VKTDRNISFNDAWKDFLIARPVPYQVGAWIYFDSNKKVVQIDFTEFLKRKEIEGQRYYCDESPLLDIPLCYPEQMVVSEMENGIAKSLLGKPFEERKRDPLKGKSEHSQRKIEAQLGGATKSEVKKLYSEKRYWETLFSLHQILEHRLRKLIMYKSMDIDYPNSKIFVTCVKENICKKIERFSLLTDIAFLIGEIKNNKEELVKFNKERNQIAHDLLKKKIRRNRLKSQCKLGLKLMDSLKDSFSKIIPKPKFIEMSKFSVKSIKVPKERPT